jgi:hypothetical protein
LNLTSDVAKCTMATRSAVCARRRAASGACACTWAIQPASTLARAASVPATSRPSLVSRRSAATRYASSSSDGGSGVRRARTTWARSVSVKASACRSSPASTVCCANSRTSAAPVYVRPTPRRRHATLSAKRTCMHMGHLHTHTHTYTHTHSLSLYGCEGRPT